MSEKIAIHWFRQDLRILDNPALVNATQLQNVLPIYILDDVHPGSNAMGSASRWWLHNSLNSLTQSLGRNLSVYQGNPIEILKDLVTRFKVGRVCWNQCYEPWRRMRDIEIEEYLEANGIEVQTCNGSLLWEPETITNKEGLNYKVFTPYYDRGCLSAESPREPISAPTGVNFLRDEAGCTSIEALQLRSNIGWDVKFESYWQVGEEAALQHLQKFIGNGLACYKVGRDFPAESYVSKLSPHLHFGEISPHQVWHSVRSTDDNEHIDYYCRELAWREFSYYQLFYNQELPSKNVKAQFDHFPWVKNETHLRAWQSGQTGIPIVDAGMRELWQTGYMHNRARMIVGSFLVKNLLMYWHHGERWFWDTLVDADLANNCANWQWVAGSGADAAPYFRIFNPVLQSQKFDPTGSYIRTYVPELAQLPKKYLFNPWTAPESILMKAGITLGDTYPKPIVDLKQSRDAALEAFHVMKAVN